MSEAVRLAGERVANLATQIWEEDVFDARVSDKTTEGLRCKTRISDFTRENNWGTYKGDGSGTQWCGMFAWYCWKHAGSLDPKWLKSYSQSTYRNQLWAQYKNWSKNDLNPRAADPTDRRLYVDLRKPFPAGFTPQQGDVVIVGDGTPSFGDHITLLTDYDAVTGAYKTISGNGGGLGPNGNSREGVSLKTYYLNKGGYRVMWLIRPAFGDLLAEQP